MDITKFEKYSFDNFGYVRLPQIIIDNQKKQGLGLSINCTNFEFLSALARNAFKQKEPLFNKEKANLYKEQLEFELNIVNELDFVDYYLLVWMVINKMVELDCFRDHGRGCLNKHALILTKNGYKKIHDIDIGDTVLNSDREWVNVLKTHKYPCNETMVNITIAGNTNSKLFFTTDHKVLVIKDPFRALRHIKNEHTSWVNGSYSINKNQYLNYNNAEWIPAKDVQKNDYVLRPIVPHEIQDIDQIDLKDFAESYDDEYVYELKTNKKYKRFLKVDQKFLYFLGYYIGDGWYKHHKTSNEVGLAFHSEDNLKELHFFIDYFKEYNTRITKHKHKKLIQFFIKSRIFKNFIMSLNLGKCANKHIPIQFLTLPKEKLMSLLDGLIDSDGSKQKNRFCYDTINKILAYQVRNLAEYLGYITRLNKRKKHGKNKESYKIVVSTCNNQNLNRFSDDRYVYLAVKNVTYTKNHSKHVYDLTVDGGNPSYTTDKFIVHNSCCASLIFWLLGITGVDPIDKELIFARFISKVRAKKKVINGITYIKGDLAPDVDLNIGGVRNNILEWLREIYKGKIAKIANLNTYTGKMLIKDVAKIVEDVSEEEAQRLANMIEKHAGIVEDIDETIVTNEDFKAWTEKHQKAYDIALKLRGIIKGKSSHASGYIISYDELFGNMPLEFNKEKELTVGYSKDDAANFAIKLDLLGLTSDEIINDVLHNIPEKIEDIELDTNSIVYDQFQNNTLLPYGLYQISADFARQVLNKVKPKNIYELSDVNALARPGALAYLENYSENTATCPHPAFEKILAKTRQVCLYQEQMMQMAMAIGFTAEEAELLRRCITSDTLFISKSRGYISIKTLLKDGYKDDLFLVMDEFGQQQWKKITNIWSTGTHQIKYVEARNGMFVKATKWHQFLTHQGWKARHYLNNNDYLVCAKNVNYIGQDIISKELAIIIAGLVTDGYFVDGRSATFVNYDKEVMDKFIQCFNVEFGPNKLNTNNINIAILRIHQKLKIKEYLQQGKSASKQLPEIMLGMTKETTREFLSFIFACEGTICTTELSITSKSRIFIQQLQLLLLRFGIRSNTLRKRNIKYGIYYVLDIGQHKDIVKFNDELSIHLQTYKKNKLNQLINRVSNENNTTDIIPIELFKKFIYQYGFILKNCSGHYFTGNIGRKSAINFYNLLKSQGTTDIKWEQLFNGNQEYVKIENLDNEIKEIETFDFTVDNDTPFIIANGIVIHNCVGKKLVDEVKEWKDRIYQKCQANGFNNDVGDILWKILDDSSKYSFNLSHSIATSYIGALTVYLKYKYPLQFYLSCLKFSGRFAKPIEEIKNIAKELAYFNIKLLPPHLLKSDMNFKIEDGNIRFGLLAIKGISDKTMETLQKFRKEYANKFEIFKGAEDAGISIGVLSALIQAGALDGFGCTRSRLVLEAQTWNILTDKEKKLVSELGEKYEYKLLDIILLLTRTPNEKGKMLIKASRLETIKKKYLPYKMIYLKNKANERFANWYYERSLLGYCYKDNLRDIFKATGLMELMQFKDVLDEPERSEVVITGVVTMGYSRVSRNGNKYFKMRIEDEFGYSLDIYIFNDNIQMVKEANGRLPEEENIVILRGRKRGADVVFADQVNIMDSQIYMKLSALRNAEADQKIIDEI